MCWFKKRNKLERERGKEKELEREDLGSGLPRTWRRRVMNEGEKCMYIKGRRKTNQLKTANLPSLCFGKIRCEVKKQRRFLG